MSDFLLTVNWNGVIERCRKGRLVVTHCFPFNTVALAL